MAFDGTEGGEITLSEGAALTKEYRSRNSSSIKAHFFGKEVLSQLLDQEGCMGIRMYYGQDEDGNSELVLVGADASENDMLDLIIDNSVPCPNYCSSPNALNS
jgi:hypothetical protein